MKHSYQSCGKIDVANKKATIFTYLPDLNINFKFISLFNISTASHYGIVGILVNDGKNIDLSAFPPKLSPIPGLVNLINLDYRFSKFGFNELTEDDEICFYCFHDDEFNTVNLGSAEKYHLKDIQDNLPLLVKVSDHIITEIDPETYFSPLDVNGADAEPKKGNGGVLTVDGSCTP